MKKPYKLNAQSGNVMVYILIAVALFAALGGVVANMMRQSGSSIGGEKQGIYAGEIISYAQNIRNTVQNLRISNGCADTDISFENPIVDGYEHTPSGNENCQVFGSAGGNAYVIPNPDWLDDSHTGQSTYGDYVFTQNTPISGIAQDTNGGDGNDIAVVLNFIKSELCKEINKKAGIENPDGAPPVDTGDFDTTTKFTGTFPGPASPIDAPETFGQTFGCLQDSAKTKNVFYFVLLAR